MEGPGGAWPRLQARYADGVSTSRLVRVTNWRSKSTHPRLPKDELLVDVKRSHVQVRNALTSAFTYMAISASKRGISTEFYVRLETKVVGVSVSYTWTSPGACASATGEREDGNSINRHRFSLLTVRSEHKRWPEEVGAARAKSRIALSSSHAHEPCRHRHWQCCQDPSDKHEQFRHLARRNALPPSPSHTQP